MNSSESSLISPPWRTMGRRSYKLKKPIVELGIDCMVLEEALEVNGSFSMRSNSTGMKERR
ncbi:hypothetical protein WG66_005940 [Moniliophthora roreri]|nr:hypothetical protein WG66_005940 [Moniliophthora roreri]